MDIVALRQELHKYINDADEEQLLRLYTFISDNDQAEDIYTDELMKELYQRREDHRSGKSESFTAQESLDMIRKMKKP